MKKHIHMMGIGGVGMAGLACLLHQGGHRVSGCDLEKSIYTDWLEGLGIPCALGHHPDHLTDDVERLIYSTAIPTYNPEWCAAQKRGLRIMKRGEALARWAREKRTVAVTGTHGKTTVTAMIVHIMKSAGCAPSFFVGGALDQSGLAAGCGIGEGAVIEADESDGTLVYYYPEVSVLTNIEHDHLEHFKNFNALLETYQQLADQTSGPVVYCADDVRAAAVGRSQGGSISYGFSRDADVRGEVVGNTELGICCAVHAGGSSILLELPVQGKYNAQNALAAFAVCLHWGLDKEVVAEALHHFTPVKRRFERVGRYRGSCIYTDYAHHPTELEALLESAHSMPHNRLIMVYQPHRYTRTAAMKTELAEALRKVDILGLLPVFSASEKVNAEGTSRSLAEALEAAGARPCEQLDRLEDGVSFIRKNAASGDLVLVVGAGDVYKVAEAMMEQEHE